MRVGGEDMSCALKEVRPSAMREVTIEVPKVHQTMGGGVAELECEALVDLCCVDGFAGVVVGHWWARGDQAEAERVR